jgi:chemotaxis protein MotB
MANPQPIIIVRKKTGHGGHHGGAWKVAYADFVTAMMALFIVLWLLNTSKKVQEAVSSYFKDPAAATKHADTKGLPNSVSGSGENFVVSKDNMPELKQELEKRIRQMNDFEKLKNQVEMSVTSEGLRIELLETEKGTFFELGRSTPNDTGRELLSLLAQELGKIPNQISIEGHTDSKPYAGGKEYSNWELSADRANAARRLMQRDGLRENQVSQIRGYADQMLRTPNDPLNASNRRISLIVQYLEKKAEQPSKDPERTGAKPENTDGPK